MDIQTDRVVTFHYRMSEPGSEPLENSHDSDPMVYLHGHRAIIAGLEDAMEGKQPGDSFTMEVEPENAYGARRPDAQQRIPIKHVRSRGKLRPGNVVQVKTRHGPKEVVVVKVGKFNVDVDTNHPLAGKVLSFDIQIVDVREATPEEIAHGHVHGQGGHHH